jgi:hypothetical protein
MFRTLWLLATRSCQGCQVVSAGIQSDKQNEDYEGKTIPLLAKLKFAISFFMNRLYSFMQI